MNCLIVEDEPLAMLRLKEYVQRVPFLQLNHALDNALDAIGVLQKEKIDLLFLDIEMDGFSGIQLLESLPKRPAVILTTAFDQYALKGFDLQVVDYLLKPYTFERFLQAVTRAYESIHTGKENEATQSSFLFVKTEYRLQKVSLDNILFVEGMRDYRRIHLDTEKIMTLETFGELAQQLPESMFCRVHKSYLVALNKIEAIERDRIRIQNTLIPISDTYRERFYQSIGRPLKSP
jgi:two-component system LytT family response regulator